MADTAFPTDIAPRAFDHVALWVRDRDELADALCTGLGMHVIERTDDFTLVGVDALLGKLTLFAVDDEREPGVLGRIVLRVANIAGAIERLGEALHIERSTNGSTDLLGPQGVRLGLIRRPGVTVDYDLDHVSLRVPDPKRTTAALEQIGFRSDRQGLWVGDRRVRLVKDDPDTRHPPLLNHLALLVDSVDEHLRLARERGIEVEEIKDAPNTYAAFVRGPDGIRVEYVEHKPGFALV